MIKLPDFSTCLELQQLLFQMGIKSIPELKEIEFIRTKVQKFIGKIPKADFLEYKEKLQLGAVELGKGEKFESENNLITINGLKACIYIKNHDANYATSSYKYHLCWCGTIESMVNSYRRNRYVATTRDDGYFPVVVQNTFPIQEKNVRLELCSNCKKMLEKRNMYFYPFTLKEFYKRYQTSIGELFQREETVTVQEKYAPNHKEIADEYKKSVGYKCMMCNVDCSQHQGLLHMHHKNGDGQDNRRKNLLILCVDCHSKQDNHAHMLQDTRFKEQIQNIKKLRIEQGIYTLIKKSGK